MHRWSALGLVAASVALTACADSSKVTAPSLQADGAASFNNGNGNGNGLALGHTKVCPSSNAGEARCHAWVESDENGNPHATPAPTGFGPADLQSAYGLAIAAANNGAGATIAIVDAYDDPNAEADLNVYRSQFGLGACTTANGCFRKVNQNGVQGSYPQRNGGWAQEISLDLDMASAVCPKCKILLVEASSASFANLATAVDRAATMGATVISNSYGGGEYSTETSDQSHYNHPGVAITVSSGDAGYGVEFPAASQYVIAVGGTHLVKASNSRGWTETVWSGAGSGCSAYIAKPGWQGGTCARRTVADVAAVADPNTGVAVYDSFSYRGAAGWLRFGGTSVAAPLVGGVYALAGANFVGSYLYSHSGSLFDVVSGSNGSCGGSYLCTGVTGYDGPTGLGTPNGISAF